MSTVRANNYYDASGGSAAQLYGVSMRNGGTAWVNRIINGDMRIDQRNAGASVTVNSSSDFFPVDRWNGTGQSSDGVFTAQQVLKSSDSTNAPVGFSSAVKLTVTTADASIGSTQRYVFRQLIEGNNISDLEWGTANAVAVTLSFSVKSSVTGTFSGSLMNSAADRSYPFTFAINAANTWETKTITIPGDTTGTWLTTNGTGIQVSFDIGCGSGLRGTAGAWAAANYRGATGAVQLIATLNATFFITGVQLEAGTVASPFERRDYGRELMMCQRYYAKSYNIDVAPGTNTTVGAKTSRIYNTDAYLPQLETRLLVSMRATPTVTWYTTAGTSGSVNVGVGTNTVNAQYDAGMNSTGWLYVNGSVSSGNQITAQFVASSEL